MDSSRLYRRTPKPMADGRIKVSVLMSQKLYLEVIAVANDERRLIAPACVVLLERGLKSESTTRMRELCRVSP